MLEENNDRLLNHLSDKITGIIGSINTVLIGTDPLTGVNFVLAWVEKEYIESHEKQLILKTFKVIQHIILNFFPESINNIDESIDQSMDQLYGKELSIDDRDLLKELIFYAFCYFKDRYYRVFYPDTEYVTTDKLRKGDRLITLFVGSQILKDLNTMLNFGIDPLNPSNGKK